MKVDAEAQAGSTSSPIERSVVEPVSFFSALHRPWLLFLFLFTGLYIANGVFFYSATHNSGETTEKIRQSMALFAALKDTHTAVLKLETGQRGYLVTGQPRYLEPYNEARAILGAQLIRLDALSETSQPEQQAAVDTMVTLVTEKQAEVAQILETWERDPEAAVDIVYSGYGRRLMTEIDDLVTSVEEEVERNIDAFNTRQILTQQIAITTLAVASFLGLFLLGLFCWSAIGAIRRSRELNQKLRESNDFLEERIAERTAELNVYANALQASNRELEDFAFVASHDLQEPLRKIQAFGSRLQDKYSEQLGEGADYVERMQSASSRMSRLITDLLQFSRITTRKKPFEEFSLQELVNNVLDDLELAIQDAGATVTVPDDLPNIYGDETQIRQVIQNLLGNALKFSAKDRPPQVKLQWREGTMSRDGSKRTVPSVRLEITDNGIGFEQNYTDRIFVPFQRLHHRTEYEGNGIGLAVCRRVVERHGGQIYAHSTVGQGSTFTIEIPNVDSNNTLDEMN